MAKVFGLCFFLLDIAGLLIITYEILLSFFVVWNYVFSYIFLLKLWV